MSTLKNLQFGPTAVMLKDGDMLYLQSRQEIDVSKVKFNQKHLDNLIKANVVTQRGEVAVSKGREKEAESTTTADAESKPKKPKN